MSVELDPAELGFRRPFTNEVSEVLHLRNRNETPVAFKVKTTAPKQYCVRPNSGRIEPGQAVEISVLLQAMKEDPPLDAKCRDKFLVQSTAITPQLEQENVSSIWSAVEKQGREAIKERKIRVSFLPPAGEEGIGAGAVGAGASTAGASALLSSQHEEAPPTYSSPSPNFGSPKQEAQDFNTPQKSMGEDTRSLLANPGAAMTAASSVVSDAASTTQQALQQQLDSAKATIAQLRAAAEENGLRLRKTAGADKDVPPLQSRTAEGMAMKTEGINGVPIQVVAALCLLSFLLAYFFF